MDKDKFEIICDLVDRLTARKLEEVPHLCIENFSSELLAHLLKACNECGDSNIDIKPGDAVEVGDTVDVLYQGVWHPACCTGGDNGDGIEYALILSEKKYRSYDRPIRRHSSTISEAIK